MLADGAAQHLLHRGDDLVEVEDLRLDHLPAGEGEQLAGEARRPFGGPRDLSEVAAGRFQALWPVGFGRGGEFLGDERRVVEDHGEEVVEVVRDPAGELAEVLQALGLQHLFLRPLLRLRDFAVHTWLARRTQVRPSSGRYGHLTSSAPLTERHPLRHALSR